MAPCKNCKKDEVKETLVEKYVDDLMGAPFEVVLERSVVQHTCAACGTPLGVVIPDLRGLVAAVAMARALDPDKLSGAEIRFLRRAVGWKAVDVAEILEVSPEHVSRCEKGTAILSNGLEKSLRHFACQKIKREFVVGIEFDLECLEQMKIAPSLAFEGGKKRVRRWQFRRVLVREHNKKNGEGWGKIKLKDAA